MVSNSKTYRQHSGSKISSRCSASAHTTAFSDTRTDGDALHFAGQRVHVQLSTHQHDVASVTIVHL